MNALMAVLILLQTQPTGEVTSVEEGKIRVDLGAESGLKTNDGLIIYSKPEVITVPGTNKPAYRRERQIATATIVEVSDKEIDKDELFESIETYIDPLRLVKHPRKQIRPEPKVVVRLRFLLTQPSVQAAHRRDRRGVSLAEIGL